MSVSEVTNCDHDWRVDPFHTLSTVPAMNLLVCAKCRQVGSRVIPDELAPSRDVEGWPKANPGPTDESEPSE